MKNMRNIFFNHEKYKEKIYNITNLRILSFEIYKLFIFYSFMSILTKLCHYFPFSIFYEIEYNFFRLTKIFIYLLIIDISYFILFKSNGGQFTIIEKIVNSILKPNLIKLLAVSLSFIILYLTTIEMKSLMPRLNDQYIKDRYNIGPIYRDEYEENYYERKGLTKSTIYEYSDRLYIIFSSLALLFHFILIKQNINLWPKLELFRIGNFKYNLKICLKNIGLVWTPVFFVIYVIFIFFYHNHKCIIFSFGLIDTGLQSSYNINYVVIKIH